MEKTYVGFCLALVAILVIGVANASAQTQATRITKVITLAGGEIKPEDIEINQGDTVVWAAVDQPARVYFWEGTPVKLACVAPTRFHLNKVGAYTSRIIPPGGIASLCFVEPGTYQYVVFFKGEAGDLFGPQVVVPVGTITVR